jgi:ATP-binding cassette subfamily B protein
LSLQEFAAIWTGYLLLVVPNDAASAAIAGYPPTTPWRRFVSLLAAHRGILAEAVCCALLMTLLGISTSYFVQHLVDSVLVRNESTLLNALGTGMAMILVFRLTFAIVRQYLLAHIGRKVDLALIANYTRHLLRLPQSFFETRQIGEILSRVNDTGKVREAVSGAALTAVVDGVLVVFTTAVLWMYDAHLALVAALFGPLLFLVVLIHHPATRRRSRAAMEDSAHLSAQLAENISGVETFKAYAAGRLRAEESENRLVRLTGSTFALQMLNISMTTAGNTVNAVAGLVILWYGGHRVMEGVLTIGELMFFYTLLGYMLDPLERMASLNLQIQDALVALDRLYQIMDLETEDSSPGTAVLQPIRQGIELRGVSFRYGCREQVLENVNLQIPAGATVAIVGESGCGKSTLLKLLMRFRDPLAGSVLFDGVDARDLDLDSLRRHIGFVSQEPFVVNATIRDNIALGKPAASLNDIIEAARIAGLSEFIDTLPDRYGTVVGERGVNLSGGQRQRLAIARALLHDPDILLFDEATSHLDTATEHAIQQTLRTAFAEKTVVLIAHRLSTIREADFICVMHNGRIVEQGSHHELIASAGRYATLWRAQAHDSDMPAHAPAVNGHLHGFLNGKLNGQVNGRATFATGGLR